MGNGRSTSALHAPVGTAASAQSQERKRERRLRRALGCSAPAQRLAPSRAASPAPESSASPLCGVLGQQHPPSSSWAQPCLAVPMALWADFWRWVLSAVLKNLKCHCAPPRVHKWAGPELQAEHAHRRPRGRHTPALLPPEPHLPGLALRRPGRHRLDQC